MCASKHARIEGMVWVSLLSPLQFLFRHLLLSKGRKMSKISQRKTLNRQLQTVAVNDGEIIYKIYFTSSHFSSSFRRDADENGTLSDHIYASVPSSQLFLELPARPSFRSSLTQPSQMGNFKHQSLRAEADREGQERLRNASRKYSCFK